MVTANSTSDPLAACSVCRPRVDFDDDAVANPEDQQSDGCSPRCADTIVERRTTDDHDRDGRER